MSYENMGWSFYVETVFLSVFFTTHLAFSLVLHGSICFLLYVNGVTSLAHTQIATSDVEFKEDISTLLRPTTTSSTRLPTETNI